jgi:hypothetical protein
MSRKAAGMSAAPAIPLTARRTKKEYLSGRKEMTRLRTPRAIKPNVKTGLAEKRSDTRPQRRRKALKVTAYEVMTQDCCAKSTDRSVDIGPGTVSYRILSSVKIEGTHL